MRKTDVWAVVLAAGYSSRMGCFKPMLDIGGSPAIERVIHTLLQGGISSVVVVTGHQQQLLEPIISRMGAHNVVNERFPEGMFTSVQKGISVLPEDISGCLLTLVDYPLIEPEVIRLLLDRHEVHPGQFLVPTFQGKKGHPLMIPLHYRQEILADQGKEGLKGITRRHEEQVIRVPVETESVVLDMDTPEAYQELLAMDLRQKSAEQGRGTLWEDLGERRLFLVRHGETQQHQGKILLGQKDVPLSEKGREQARAAGEKLLALGVDSGVLYTSDLSRALETAEIIGGCLGLQRNIEPALREMALGAWDGVSIEEIKGRYPDEFAQRGKQLLHYKLDHESENFYDLQYRVIKSLQSILHKETKDLIVVAHAGVIKVILAHLHKSDLGEEIKRKIPNGEIIVISGRTQEECRR